MTRVIADITTSLDGFVTGPRAGPEAGLGDDGMPLHDWVFHGHEVDEAVLATATERSGAVVMGRNLFDVVDAPGGWSDDIGPVDGGLVDELVLHVSPIVMGAGTPLWAGVGRRLLRQTDVRVSPYATHITYALAHGPTPAG